MKMMTKAIEKKLPKLYANEKKDPKDVRVVVKFFCPWNQWTWYVTEGEFQNGTWLFFGYVVGNFNKLGYFTLADLEKVIGPWGLKIERDLYLGDKTTLKEVMDKNPAFKIAA